MTPVQKLKAMILQRYIEMQDLPTRAFTAENVDELYDQADDIGDARNELRHGEHITDVPIPYNRALRDYEPDSVAAKALDGSWIGWTYWHGGGKHSNPEEIDWVEYAYDLSCTEKEVVTIERTFTKPA